MYLGKTITVMGLVRFGWKQCTLFAVLSTTVCVLDLSLGFTGIAIPFLPMLTLGTAMSIILGFRNNSAYDRWWEARIIWGGLVNQSRIWAAQVTTFLAPADGETAEAAALQSELVHRHLAFLYALRTQLRGLSDFGDVAAFLPEAEAAALGTWRNPATQINARNAARARAALDRGWLDPFRHVAMLETVGQFYELQGKCERIKHTPLLRQYSFFTTVLVWIFILLLPIGFVRELGWWTIPMSVLIGWIFVALEQVGRYTEDPFDNFVHDVPMTALCRTIEIDLRQMLGETDLPLPIEPVRNVLM